MIFCQNTVSSSWTLLAFMCSCKNPLSEEHRFGIWTSLTFNFSHLQQLSIHWKFDALTKKILYKLFVCNLVPFIAGSWKIRSINFHLHFSLLYVLSPPWAIRFSEHVTLICKHHSDKWKLNSVQGKHHEWLVCYNFITYVITCVLHHSCYNWIITCILKKSHH